MAPVFNPVTGYSLHFELKKKKIPNLAHHAPYITQPLQPDLSPASSCLSTLHLFRCSEKLIPALRDLVLATPSDWNVCSENYAP